MVVVQVDQILLKSKTVNLHPLDINLVKKTYATLYCSSSVLSVSGITMPFGLIFSNCLKCNVIALKPSPEIKPIFGLLIS